MRYGTDEIVEKLERLKALYSYDVDPKTGTNVFTEHMNAIIARLRNADALAAELKEADNSICNLCRRLNPQHANCTSCDERGDRVKALSDYEGKG